MIRVGKIVATHGLQGALIMTHVAGSSTWLKNGMAIMVEMQKGSYIPYFVTEFKVGNDKEYTIHLEDVGTVDTAKRLVAKHVYVNEDVLVSFAKTSPLLWIGFNITDVNTGLLGPVEDVVQMPNQWLATVRYNGSEVLVPLIDPVLKEVNLKAKRIIVELPQGLLDVYTN